MYDYATINSDIFFYFGMGIFALLCGLYRAFLKKEEEDRKSWLIGGICMCIFFFGFGISDIIAAKNPDIEIYIGEYIETDSMGTGSTRKTYCFFDAHNGSLQESFISADIEYFLIPEKGKWYEIHYLPDTTYRTPVKVEEVSPPEYYEESSETK